MDARRQQIRAILNHGLQIFQDAYAGAKNADEATGSFTKKVAKAIAGELGIRSGSGVDRLTALRRIVAREVAKKEKQKK